MIHGDHQQPAAYKARTKCRQSLYDPFARFFVWVHVCMCVHIHICLLRAELAIRTRLLDHFSYRPLVTVILHEVHFAVTILIASFKLS